MKSFLTLPTDKTFFDCYFTAGFAHYGTSISALLWVVIIKAKLRPLLPYRVQAVFHRRFTWLNFVVVWIAYAALISAGTLFNCFSSDDWMSKPQLLNNGDAEDKYMLAIRENRETPLTDSVDIAAYGILSLHFDLISTRRYTLESSDKNLIINKNSVTKVRARGAEKQSKYN